VEPVVVSLVAGRGGLGAGLTPLAGLLRASCLLNVACSLLLVYLP
jgi:hypothetical protein